MSYIYVVKRNGIKVEFDKEKITQALTKAGKATSEFDYSIASTITSIIMSKLQLAYLSDESRNDSVTLEFIQDAVEATLLNTRYKKTARAYAIYREQRSQAREITTTFNINLINKYVGQNDWKIKENSNTTYSLQGLNNYMANEISSQYWLNHIYPTEIKDSHTNGDFHIHDLGLLAPYCCGWSLEDLLLRGFCGVPSKVASTPAKHFRTALGQLVNFIFSLQGEIAGAQAVSNFDTLLAPFVKHDNLTYAQVKQSMQEFIFNLNISTRVGFQSPFSNITLDLNVPSTHKATPVIIGGKYLESTYSDYQNEMNMINQAFCEVMTEGDAAGRIFTFPIPTYNISKEFDWDNPAYDSIWKMTGKYGVPYFCLEENTRIIKADMTSTTIGRIRIGDKLLNEKGQPITVVNKYEHTSFRQALIRLENGEEIICSLNHKWPTNNGLKMTQELNLEDKLQRFVAPYLFFENSQMQMDFQEADAWFDFFKLLPDLTPIQTSPGKIAQALNQNCEQVVYIQPKLIDNTDPELHFFQKRNVFDSNSHTLNIPLKVTHELGRFLGYLIGDGGYSKEGRITFTKDDKIVIDSYCNLSKELFGVDPTITMVGINKDCFSANIYAVQLTRFFRHIGLTPCKGSNKIIPRIIYQSSKETMLSFLGGLFDTDGSVSSTANLISYSSMSEKLIKQIQIMLLRFGIMSRKSRIKKAFMLTITGNNVSRFQKQITLTHARKSERLATREETIRNSMGDPLIVDYKQMEQLITDKILPDNYKYRIKKDALRYRKNYYRAPAYVAAALFNNDLVRADIVSRGSDTYDEINANIELITMNYGEAKLVDIEVSGDSHLFLLDGGVISHNSNFVNSDMSPEDSRSMCPLHSDTEVWINHQNAIHKKTLKEVSELFPADTHIDNLPRVFYHGVWRRARIIYVRPETFVEVTVKENDLVHKIVFEGRHEQPTATSITMHDDGTKWNVELLRASELKVGMFLPFDKSDIQGFSDSQKNDVLIVKYFPIRDIQTRVATSDESSYCFEVLTDNEEERYFQLVNGLITHNCRLRLDTKELSKRGGGLFGANPLTGSLNVITINMPRLGFISTNDENFISNLDILLYRAKQACTIKRRVIDEFTERGMYPYSAFYLNNVKEKTGSCWTNHFNTIGIIGMEEACKNYLGCSVGNIAGKLFAEKVLDHIRMRMIEFQEETGMLYNLEATPAESTSYRLALKDKEKFGTIISAASECGTPYYTNSSHLPVNFTDDIFELLDLQDELQTKYTGGTVIHLFIGEELTDINTTKGLVRRVCENYRLPYFSITPTFSTCDDHGYLTGKQEECPTCGKDTEIFSRVVGYYRPTKSWNKGKEAEFAMRKTFKV